jgi:hypothetical protein
LSFYWIKFFFHYVCASAKLHGISLHLRHVSPLLLLRGKYVLALIFPFILLLELCIKSPLFFFPFRVTKSHEEALFNFILPEMLTHKVIWNRKCKGRCIPPWHL